MHHHNFYLEMITNPIQIGISIWIGLHMTEQIIVYDRTDCCLRTSSMFQESTSGLAGTKCLEKYIAHIASHNSFYTLVDAFCHCIALSTAPTFCAPGHWL